jgi:DNA-binding transcriptional ArsR family regulator
MKMSRDRKIVTTRSPDFRILESSILSSAQASELEDLFKVLANDTRLRLLHALARLVEVRVSGLCEAVGMRPQAVSNQLQRLSDRGIVSSRREGNSVYYRIADPRVPMLLDYGICLAEDFNKRRQAALGKSAKRNRQ